MVQESSITLCKGVVRWTKEGNMDWQCCAHVLPCITFFREKSIMEFSEVIIFGEVFPLELQKLSMLLMLRLVSSSVTEGARQNRRYGEALLSCLPAGAASERIYGHSGNTTQ